MRLFRHRRKQPFDAELNITAFMNLMVVLVPFLLITAVFSQMSILELQLPGNRPNSSSPPKGLGLEVRLYNSGDVHVRTRKQGTIAKLQASNNIALELNTLLQSVKNQSPSETMVTLLIEDAVPYQNVIQMMDAVRLVPKPINGQIIKLALFPDVAIGSLPNQLNKSSTASITQAAPRHGARG